MLGDASFDIWACGGKGGGYIILNKNVCCPAVDKKMLRVVYKIIIQVVKAAPWDDINFRF